MKILALDLGANLAAAHNLDDVGDAPTVFYWKVMGTRPERAGITFKYLSPLFGSLGSRLDVVVYERPFARGFHATRSLWGLAGIVEGLAEYSGIAVCDVTPSEIKKFATGNGKAEKAEMIEASARLGYFTTNEHEADAVCLLKYMEKYGAKGED